MIAVLFYLMIDFHSASRYLWNMDNYCAQIFWESLLCTLLRSLVWPFPVYLGYLCDLLVWCVWYQRYQLTVCSGTSSSTYYESIFVLVPMLLYAWFSYTYFCMIFSVAPMKGAWSNVWGARRSFQQIYVMVLMIGWTRLCQGFMLPPVTRLHLFNTVVLEELSQVLWMVVNFW